jgi:hypothetical protein
MTLADWMHAFGGISGMLGNINDNPNDWKERNTRPYAFVGWSKKLQFARGSNDPITVPSYSDWEGSTFGHPQEDLGTSAGNYHMDWPARNQPAQIQNEFIWYRSEFIDNWTGCLGIVAGASLSKALDDAYEATKGSGVPVAFKEGYGMVIYGYSLLKWKQCNSQNWTADLP